LNDHHKTNSADSDQSRRRLKAFWIASATALLTVVALLAATYAFRNIIHVLDKTQIRRLTTHLGGNGYVIAMPSAGDSVETPYASKARLYENGRRLGPAHSQPADVCSAGKGAFVHWGKSLIFSTSDNSDPRTNGRRYHVKLPNATALAWRDALWNVLGGLLAVMSLMAAALLTGQCSVGTRTCSIYFVALVAASCLCLSGYVWAGTLTLLIAAAFDFVLSRGRLSGVSGQENEEDRADKSFYRFMAAGWVVLGLCRVVGINKNSLYLVFLAGTFIVLLFLVRGRRAPSTLVLGLTLFMAVFPGRLEIKLVDPRREIDVKLLPKTWVPHKDQLQPGKTKDTVAASVRPVDKPVEFTIDLSAYDGFVRQYGAYENRVIIAGYDLRNLEVATPGFRSSPVITGEKFRMEKLMLNLEIGAHHPSAVTLKLKPKEHADGLPGLYLGPESCGFQRYPDAVWMQSLNSKSRLTFHAVEKPGSEDSR